MTRKDKLLLLAIVAVLALVVVHALLSVDMVKGGKTAKACLIAIPLTDQINIATIKAAMARYSVLFRLSGIL